jgi:hypothetical protein
MVKKVDLDVIRTRSLQIWNLTRYRCATKSLFTAKTKSPVLSNRFHVEHGKEPGTQRPSCKERDPVSKQP